jgi:uncharacterized protein YhbP (UPF0306 family)
MDEHIIQFLLQQTCATICCADREGNPYCFNCYYAFNPEEKLIYFKSSPDTHHCLLLAENPVVAGTVLPDKLNKLMPKGVQLKGKVFPHDETLAQGASAYYHKKLPVALAMKGDMYTIRLDSVKMKDSRLGFGTGLFWNRYD